MILSKHDDVDYCLHYGLRKHEAKEYSANFESICIVKEQIFKQQRSEIDDFCSLVVDQAPMYRHFSFWKFL